MRIETESGSVYLLEDRHVTRISETPIHDRNTHKPRPEVYVREKLEYWDDPELGKTWFFATTSGGRITTTKIIKITEDELPFPTKGFERAER